MAGPADPKAVVYLFALARTPDQSITREVGPLSPADTAIDPGCEVGRYRIESELGRGGMGRVYRALDPVLDRHVAIKVLRGVHGRMRAEAVAQVRREARAMARLRHPNVVEVFAVETSANRPELFIAMELIDGPSLSAWLEDGRHTQARVLEVFGDAGAGLAAAHDAGLIHRDFKPSNVLLGSDGRARVGDFGLARAWMPSQDEVSVSVRETSRRDPEMTFTGSVVGTPTYMAPEQHQGDAADERSDQYSFCVALYRALNGTAPFEGPREHLLDRKLEGAPRLGPARGVPRWLGAAIARGLRPNPADRWPTMAELLEALRPRPRRYLLGAVAGTAVVFTSVAIVRAEEPKQCGDEKPIDDAWNSQRDDVRAAFTESGASHAAPTFEKFAAAMDRYAQSWNETRTTACTLDRPEVETCLASGASRANALLQAYASDVESASVDKAIASVLALAPPADCLAPSSSQAPPTHEVLELAAAMADAGRYSEGLELIEGLRAQTNNAQQRALYAEATRLSGDFSFRLGRIDDATERLSDAYFTGLQVEDHRCALQAALRLAFIDAEARRDVDAALRWLGQAEAARDRLGAPDWARADVENARGILADGQGRYAEAKAAFTHVIEIRNADGRHDPLPIAAARNNRSSARAGLGDHAGAIEDLEAALEIYERELGATHPFNLFVLGNLTANLHRAGRFEDALVRAQRWAELTAATSGADSGDHASSLNQQALALRRLGREDEALEVFERARRTWDAVPEPGPSSALTYINYGSLLLERGELDEAEPLMAKGRETLERTLGASHPATLQAIGNVARLRHAQGRFDDAEGMLAEAISSTEALVGRDHPLMADLLKFRGDTATARGELDDARAYFEESIAIGGRHETDAAQTAEAQLALAKLVRDDSPERARELARQAKRAFTDAKDTDAAADAGTLLVELGAAGGTLASG